MSNVALLDMLANGTNPPKIMPYLGDCYDSLANLTFTTLDDGTTSSKTVNEMVSTRYEVCVIQVRGPSAFATCMIDSARAPGV